ncbi:MAG: hypothetical protein JWP25_7729 [Bradyrhizobium sp.]|jgi:hypothetical protein|nr:hypothetical protein [Bradyrhizobium sp.]
MSKCDGQEICKSARVNFTECALMATVIRFNEAALRNIEKSMGYLTFNRSLAWDFSFQSPNLAWSVRK